jgi:hypothetical protein
MRVDRRLLKEKADIAGEDALAVGAELFCSKRDPFPPVLLSL